MIVKCLFIGDIVGTPGMNITNLLLPDILKKYKPELVIANAENVSEGKGCTQTDGNMLFNLGVHVLTGGNHTWDKPTSQEFLKKEERYIRPLNYPRGSYGRGVYIFNGEGFKAGVINLQGRTFMSPIDCPFRTAEKAIDRLKEETNIIIIDMHAEATAEKQALFNYLDGKISILIGTHTHVQTCDERISENGAAYITDVGMTGPYKSIIGMKVESAINRFLYQTPQKYQPAEDDMHFSALYFEIDSNTGKTKRIERIFLPEFTKMID